MDTEAKPVSSPWKNNQLGSQGEKQIDAQCKNETRPVTNQDGND
jgi:hypothetical protein